MLDKKEINKEHSQKWEKQYLREGHSVASMRCYLSYINQFVENNKEITQKTVDKFRDEHMSNAARGALKSFFEFLVLRFEFPQDILNIRFSKRKKIHRFPDGLTENEAKKIIEKIGEFGLKEKMITLSLYSLGLRISEALKLKWEDFNWAEWLQNRGQQGEVKIKNTKRGKFRVLPTSPSLMNTLYNNHRLRNSENIPLGNLVFDYGIMRFLNDKTRTPEKNKYFYLIYARDTYSNILRKTSKSVIGKIISPHRLRHAKAQNMMDNGIPIEVIKEFLGHESIISTQIYAQASATRMKNSLRIYQDKEKLLEIPTSITNFSNNLKLLENNSHG